MACAVAPEPTTLGEEVDDAGSSCSGAEDMAAAAAPEPIILGEGVDVAGSSCPGAEDMAATTCLALCLVSLVSGLRSNALVVI